MLCQAYNFFHSMLKEKLTGPCAGAFFYCIHLYSNIAQKTRLNLLNFYPLFTSKLDWVFGQIKSNV